MNIPYNTDRMPRLGGTHSLESREKIRQAALRQFATMGHPWTGRKHRPDTIERMRIAKRGVKHSTPRGEDWRRKLRAAAFKRWSNPAFKEKMRLKQIGRVVSETTREKIRQARLRRTHPRKFTNIERALVEQFHKRRLKFEMHKTMFSRFQPDFVFDDVKLVVQADGWYWHKWPDRRERDAVFNETAREAGWTVWRFAESEILQHPEACGRAVARFIRSHPSR